MLVTKCFHFTLLKLFVLNLLIRSWRDTMFPQDRIRDIPERSPARILEPLNGNDANTQSPDHGPVASRSTRTAPMPFVQRELMVAR